MNSMIFFDILCCVCFVCERSWEGYEPFLGCGTDKMEFEESLLSLKDHKTVLQDKENITAKDILGDMGGEDEDTYDE